MRQIALSPCDDHKVLLRMRAHQKGLNTYLYIPRDTVIHQEYTRKYIHMLLLLVLTDLGGGGGNGAGLMRNLMPGHPHLPARPRYC
jgi:hypothetical protein